MPESDSRPHRPAAVATSASHWRRAAALALLALVCASANARAQDVTELTLDADFLDGRTLVGVGGVYTLGEAEGVRPQGGPDRFHLFETFDLAAGDTVEWVSPFATRNIFNLVTGGSASEISGLLRSTIPDADVYLVNPEGLLFNEAARLDLAGSFFASTADRLTFVDGSNLDLGSADQDAIDLLDVADFERFGFLNSNESIDVEGAQLVVAGDAVLHLSAARHLRIDEAADESAAVLRAGRVELSAQDRDVRVRNGQVSSLAGGVAGGSQIQLEAGRRIEIERASILTSEGPGDSLGVTLAARTIYLTGDATRIASEAVDAEGGRIDLTARRLVSITNGASLGASATGTGTAADIAISGEDLLLLDAEVSTVSESADPGQGNIDVEIDQVVNLVDGRIETSVAGAGAGRLRITAPLVVLQGESVVVADADQGSIQVESDLIVRSEDSLIEANDVRLSSAQVVRTLQTDLNERLEVLPHSFFENRVRIDRSCAAGNGEALGSLVIEQRRALPDSPDRLRLAHYPTRSDVASHAAFATYAWDPLLDWFSGLSNPSADDWLFLAQRAELLGNLTSASSAAERGLGSDSDPATLAALHAVRGRLLSRLGEPQAGEAELALAGGLALQARAVGLRAAIELDLGTVRARRGEFAGGLRALEEAERLAERVGARETLAAARANVASLRIEMGQAELVRREFAKPLAANWSEARQPAELDAQLHLALAALRVGARQQAVDRLVALATAATRLASERHSSFAWSYLAQVYVDQGLLEDAAELTRWAIEASLETADGPRLSRFHAQLADILRRQGDIEGAVHGYDMALRAAAPLGTSLGPEWSGFDPFAEDASVAPVALRQIDALLELARLARDDQERVALLFEARDRVEARRVQELKNHFQDPCISAQETRPADTLPHALVLHPVPLPDRLALIVSDGTNIRAYEVPVTQAELLETLRNTGRQIRDRTTNRYLIGARKLYDWLIRPIESEIARPGVETLVFVSGPGLRSFPMAALYDRESEQFLIEKIAVAATQGLSLTEPRPLDQTDLVVLRAGLGEGRNGERPLLYVRRELDMLAALFPGVELAGENFQLANMETALERESFDIIHIASHGRFPEDGSPPYLLTSKERLGLEALASMIRRTRFRDRPTQLITLSACETAVGDERAALGFAGLAIRSGARSTLATLWRVNDEATSDLMQYFYTHLASGGESRAGALQKAQRVFLDNAVLRHPYWWAPYVLLGNWQ